MTALSKKAFPRLRNLPLTLPLEGAIRMELQEGVPIFRSTNSVQKRVEQLVRKQQDIELTEKEEEELERYEEIDDYLSFLNRVVRNLQQAQTSQGA